MTILPEKYWPTCRQLQNLTSFCFIPHQELEHFDSGCAGVISNAIGPLGIPVSAGYAYLFYGETMRPMQLVGGAIVFFAIFIVAAVKMAKYLWGRQERKVEDVETIPLTKGEMDDQAVQ